MSPTPMTNLQQPGDALAGYILSAEHLVRFVGGDLARWERPSVRRRAVPREAVCGS